jgi:hypothetical protein
MGAVPMMRKVCVGFANPRKDTDRLFTVVI